MRIKRLYVSGQLTLLEEADPCVNDHEVSKMGSGISGCPSFLNGDLITACPKDQNCPFTFLP